MTTATETAKNLWVIGSNGEVRVGDEAALAREVKRRPRWQGLVPQLYDCVR
jgi:hypothetical protein